MAAADHPIGMIHAARKAMHGAPHNTAFDALGFTNGGHGDTDTRRRILRPDIILSVERESGELERIIRQHHMNPGLRTTAARQGLNGFTQHIIAQIIATIARWLANTQQTLINIITNSGIRRAAQFITFLRTLRQNRHHGLRPRENLLARLGGGKALRQNRLRCNIHIH